MVKFSCVNCTDRAMGCHATCKTYLREREEHQKIKKQKAIDRVMDEYNGDKKKKLDDQVSMERKHRSNYGGHHLRRFYK